MGRRMIDEGALNAQIQEATTTKQDKLYTETYSGIELTEKDNKQYISSELVYQQVSFTLNPYFYKGTYKPGDVITLKEQSKDHKAVSRVIDGMLIVEADIGTDLAKVVQFGEVIALRKAYFSPGDKGTKNHVNYEWIAINNGTATEDKQMLGTPLGIIIATKSKRKW